MFSLVIPVYNEEKLIEELLRRTIPAVESFAPDFELVFVDDGSTDNSLNLLLNWQKKDSRIKILCLSKNFGHQAAYTAGLEYSKGDYVAMMDGDLQDPPEMLIPMYRKITEDGLDIVNGKKTGRKGKRNRTMTSSLFHFLFRNVGELKEIANYGNFSMMTRNALSALLLMNEKVRYLPGMRSYIGFSQGDIEFIRDERYGGRPKMSFMKLFGLASDAIFSFSKFPLRLCLILGAIGTIIFMISGIYVVIAKISGFAATGWSSTLLSIYFLGSIQLLFLGVLGEYIYRNYKESQNRPVYFVKKYFEGSSEKK
jgi:polyisoprenyl-phosphate glycosyltransferase